MLTREQRKQLADAVFGFIGSDAAVDSMKILVGEAVQDFQSNRPFGFALRIVDYALSRPTPETFIHILNQADAAGILLELQVFVRQLEIDPTQWRAEDGTNHLFVRANAPFIDRHDLRITLQLMADGAGPPAIAIQAPTGHGKQTVSEYIEAWAGGGAFTAVRCDLRRDPEAGLLDLLDADLRLALGLDLSVDSTHVEPERHGVILARLLADAATMAPNTIWFVVNILEPSGVEPGVLKFLDELLACVRADENVARRIRVVVLSDDFSRTGLANLPEVDDRHVLPDVNLAEISQWLAAAAPGKPSGIYEVAASRVMRFVTDRSPAPSKRLEWVARQSLNVHRQLIRMT